MTRTVVIAEAGVNHNGSVETALALVDAAADAGADIVKFQTFDHSLLAADAAATAPYQEHATGTQTQAELLKPLELSRDEFAGIAQRCQERSIEFLSTAFDERSLAMLLTLGIARVKVPSGDLTHGPALLAAARLDLPLIISTGMGTLDDVRRALNVVRFGLEHSKGDPSLDDIERADPLPATVIERVSLLHCVTAYPAPANATNLRAMDTLRDTFGTLVGLSDHSLGYAIAIAAVARGAAVIEKHLTLDRSQPGPDHAASLEPAEFTAMTAGIRDVEAAIGDGRKEPAPAEADNVLAARRSLVAIATISAGEQFTQDNIGARRPGTGLSPMSYWALLGQTARRSYNAGDLIEP